MADSEERKTPRIEEKLIIKIGEAKNLSLRSNSNSTNCSSNNVGSPRDVYCTIALDQEEICRTPTKKTLSPFFGEEYQFEIPRRFRYLSVYVWDRDRSLKQDKPIGKIAIRREELHNYNHKDHWFSLRLVDADSEVQGMAHVKISFCEDAYLKRKSDYNNYDENDEENCRTNLIDFNREHDANIINSTNAFNNKTKCLLRNTSHESNVWHSNNYTTTTRNASLPNKTNQLKSSNFDFTTGGSTLTSLDSITAKTRVKIEIPECVDLTKRNSGCDPFVMVTALYSNKRTIIKRSKVRKKTVNPKFDEEFYFNLTTHDSNSKQESSNNTYTIHPLNGAELCEISISLWHDSPGVVGDNKIFLGEIRIPMRGRQQLAAVQSNAWYFLQPRTSQSRSQQRSCATPPGTRLSCDNSIGSLRLKLVYTADHVFPLATYDGLMNLLLESLEQKSITSSAVYILGELVSCKTDVAQPLVRLFTHKRCIASIIKKLAEHEILNLTDPTTIFRGNTLVSKMMDEAMRLSGLHYLHTTLRPTLEQILHEKKPCEIDPARVKDKQSIETNLNNLQDYVEKVFNAITQSAVKCPTVLCQIFHDLRECAAKYFPHNKEVRYSVVSGFIFLRFFAPAILGPKLFDLTSEPVDCQTNRTLTLISKTIQSLGNLVSSRSAQQPCKEEYTGQLYKTFCTEKHVEAVKHFLEVISTVSSNDNSNKNDERILEPVLLKEGMMTKRAQGRKRFGRKNFKQRYFRLTTHSLSYSKSKGKRPICDIPLSDILAVQKLDEGSFKMQNIFQIIRRDRPLYVQTTNCVEEKEWFDLLSKICESNSERLKHYHPCAFVNGKFTCCSKLDPDAEGCTAVSTTKNNKFQMELATSLDPARDLQRLHTLIITHLNVLKSFLMDQSSSTTSSSSSQQLQQQQPQHQSQQYSSYANNSFNSTNISTATIMTNINTCLPLQFDDISSCRKIIRQLIEVALSLEHTHHLYKQNIAKKIVLGSKQSPFGDDNYLTMRAGLVNFNQQQQQYQNSSSTSSIALKQYHLMNNIELSSIDYLRHDILKNNSNQPNEKLNC